MARILVPGGCGLMGSEVTRDLAATSDFSEIVIADLALDRARALADELGGGRVKAQKLDLSDEKQVVETFRGFDVIANCTTYHFGVPLIKAAIAAKAHYTDLGGLIYTASQLALDPQAREAGITCCLGAGCTPGLSNLMARTAAEDLGGRAQQVEIHFCSYRDLAPSPGLLDTILDEFAADQKRFYWEKGQYVVIGPFQGEKRVRFRPPLGENTVYYMPHSETHTIHRYLPGVERVSVRGAWRPAIMEAFRVFWRYGMLEEEGRRFLRQQLLKHPPTEPGAFGFFLNVEVTAADGRKAIYTSSHPDWQAASTAKMTGIPASIMAQLLAKGGARRTGVMAAEECFAPADVYAELKQRGVEIHKET